MSEAYKLGQLASQEGKHDDAFACEAWAADNMDGKEANDYVDGWEDANVGRIRD